MKKIVIMIIFCNNLILSQGAPPNFNYQIVLRDANNSNLPLKNTTKNLRFTILKGWNVDVLSYQEEQLVTTNTYGVANVIIGNGKNKVNSINDINFINDVYFIRVEVEEQGIFQQISISQLVSVPYAMAANQLDRNNAITGQVLKWNGSQWKPDTDISSGISPNLAGDANGSVTNNTVTRIQNKPVSSVIPNTGQILKWDGTQWKPDTDNSSGISPNLAGDANGSVTNNTVTRIQNKPVSSATPSTGQILKWDGTQWKPDTDNNFVNIPNLSGDANGLITNNTVTKIQNKPISGTSPSFGQILKWDGSQWKPDTDNSSGVPPTLAGDITGGITMNSISRIQGKILNAINPLNGQVLKFNGSSWGAGIDNDNQNLSINGTTLSISGGNSINLPSGGSNYWTANGNNIYKNNSGSVLIGLTSLPSNGSTLSLKGTCGIYNTNNYKVIELTPSNTEEGIIKVLSPSLLNFNYMGFNLDNQYPLMGIGVGSSIRAGFKYLNSSSTEVFANVKTFVMDHPLKLDSVIVFASVEGPEAAAYERGTAYLVNGRAKVLFSDYFSLIVNHTSTTISLTPISLDSKGLTIIEKNKDGFTVGELYGGNGNYSFDWEVKGVRKGYENFHVIRNKSEYRIQTESTLKVN